MADGLAQNVENEISIEKISNIIQMMKLLSASGPKQNEATTNKAENEETKEGEKEKRIENENTSKHYIQRFDEKLQTPAVKTIKAAIPYLEYEYQRNLGVFVKLIEIDSLLKQYQTMTVSEQNLNKGNWQRLMLRDMYEQMDGKNKNMVMMLLKLMDIRELMDNFKEGY